MRGVNEKPLIERMRPKFNNLFLTFPEVAFDVFLLVSYNNIYISANYYRNKNFNSTLRKQFLMRFFHSHVPDTNSIT
jgi:hypothetical protein